MFLARAAEDELLFALSADVVLIVLDLRLRKIPFSRLEATGDLEQLMKNVINDNKP